MTSRTGRQIHPVVLTTMLEATGRYQPELKRWLLDEYDLQEERLEQLAEGDEQLSVEPVLRVQTRLLQSSNYQKIVELAGGNAYELLNPERREGSLLARLSPGSRTVRAVRHFPDAVEPCLGEARINTFRAGGLHRFELHGSIFAEGRSSLFPVCGFYTGFLKQMLLDYRVQGKQVEETSCRACHQDQPYCEFRVSERKGEQ